VPVNKVDRGGAAFEHITDNVYCITDIALAVAVGVAAAGLVRNRRRAALEDIADQIDGITDIDLSIIIGIARTTIRRQDMLNRPCPGGSNLGQIVGFALLGGYQAIIIGESIARCLAT